ncbi:tripartite tricarboxylate transporter permease [Pararhodobacter sp. CCB-MM2]|uniref:tripartite tricarboxylate transporter permease n=1 Tax=Pararhodobacter sp. CCB-MM2 TaxID=1786003 RepID=UPI00082BE789|nr:tripartite tricarboxylate transporter permease [Pararhodobacter sp. CCB-MM2]
MDYILMGIGAVFTGPDLFTLGGFGIPAAPAMLFLGLLTGIAVGATPGLAGPMAMAVSLPILISIFGVRTEALLPVFGFLIGIMKGATVGGAVPAILFNIPGTPDAFMTTLDGHPMTKRGMPKRALKVAHLSSVSGDTLSDIALFVCAPFLAVLVERFLDLPEKTALILLSLTFIAAVMGSSVGKGLIAIALGMLASMVATGQDFHPRLALGLDALSHGFPMVSAVLGVLILGEIFWTLDDHWRGAKAGKGPIAAATDGPDGLRPGDVRRIVPHILRSSFIGTVIGALPGVGSTLAATLGYTLGRKVHAKKKTPEQADFGDGAPEGIAATEAANSAVSGANLIPVLSLGIPGNAAAVFLILAADSIGGFNPGPGVFNFTYPQVNPELVIAFGIFTLMALGNLLNWTIGGVLMRAMGVMSRVPIRYLLPVVLLVTLTAIYVQDPRLGALWTAFGFGVLGYLFRCLRIPHLPFVIAFILSGSLENTARQAFSATGGDPFFLFSSWVSTCFVALAILTVFLAGRAPGEGRG